MREGGGDEDGVVVADERGVRWDKRALGRHGGDGGGQKRRADGCERSACSTGELNSVSEPKDSASGQEWSGRMCSAHALSTTCFEHWSVL